MLLRMSSNLLAACTPLAVSHSEILSQPHIIDQNTTNITHVLSPICYCLKVAEIPMPLLCKINQIPCTIQHWALWGEDKAVVLLIFKDESQLQNDLYLNIKSDRGHDPSTSLATDTKGTLADSVVHSAPNFHIWKAAISEPVKYSNWLWHRCWFFHFQSNPLQLNMRKLEQLQNTTQLT